MQVMTRPTGTPLQQWLARVPRQRGEGSRQASRPDTALPRGIRRRRDRDLSTCARLVRRAFFEGQFQGLHAEDPRAWLSGPTVLEAWVAARDGEVVGHVATATVGLDPVSALRWREITGHSPSELLAVSRLFVRPRFRGQGVAASLVDVAVADIRSRGLVPVLEVVTTSSLAPSYSRDHGWRLCASDPVTGSRPALWMHRHEATTAWER